MLIKSMWYGFDWYIFQIIFAIFIQFIQLCCITSVFIAAIILKNIPFVYIKSLVYCATLAWCNLSKFFKRFSYFPVIWNWPRGSWNKSLDIRNSWNICHWLKQIKEFFKSLKHFDFHFPFGWQNIDVGIIGQRHT